MDVGTVIGAPPARSGTGRDTRGPDDRGPGPSHGGGERVDRPVDGGGGGGGSQLHRFEALLRRQHDRFRSRQASVGGRTPTGGWGTRPSDEAEGSADPHPASPRRAARQPVGAAR